MTPSIIKDVRKQSGLTQTQAGMMIGAALSTWQAWEAGTRNMPQAKYNLFLLMTGVTPPQL
jgi:DNA-binding transcriptional regulator YiaG